MLSFVHYRKYKKIKNILTGSFTLKPCKCLVRCQSESSGYFSSCYRSSAQLVIIKLFFLKKKIEIFIIPIIHLISAGCQTSNPPPVCCLARQVVSPCYKYCTENTCENLLNPPQICNVTCEYNNCVCADGFYRNECNECVTADQCRHQCTFSKPLTCPGANEKVNGCFDPTEAKVCENVERSELRDIFFKSKGSQPGLCALNVCDCIDGYLRNRCGQCVKAVDCRKKCCARKNDPCSQPNEFRVTRHCKQWRSSNSCKTSSRSRRSKGNCVCQCGFTRDHCGSCVEPFERAFKQSCMCTNPCATVPANDVEWQCANKCNQRDCRTMYELKNKTCELDCVYSCQCSVTKNLWYNGSHCVGPEECPPYNETLDFSSITLTHLGKLTAGLFAALADGQVSG